MICVFILGLLMILYVMSSCNVTVMINCLRILGLSKDLICDDCFFWGNLTGCFIMSTSMRLWLVNCSFGFSLALFLGIIIVLSSMPIRQSPHTYSAIWTAITHFSSFMCILVTCRADSARLQLNFIRSLNYNRIAHTLLTKQPNNLR